MMKHWFTSRQGAIGLSILTLLSEVWRGFLDAMFVFPVDFSNQSLMILGSVLFTLLFGLWAWLVLRAGQGSRTGLIAVFILNALVLLAIPISWLFFYCPAACRAEAGIFNLANTLNLVFGTLAAISLGSNILQAEHRPGLGASPGI